MGTAVVKFEPFPVPAPRDPAPRLPAWVTSTESQIKENYQIDPESGQWVDALTLPQTTMPTAEQRTAIENHHGHLSKLLDQTPHQSQAYGKETFKLIMKLLLVAPGRAGGPEMTEAQHEAYDDALEDLPYWAVGLAIRRWHRGQCGDEHDYRWAPQPAILRKIALAEAWRVREQIKLIDRLLSVVPYRDDRQALQRNKDRVDALMKASGFR